MLYLATSQKRINTPRDMLRQHFAQMFERAKREWDRTHTHRPAVIVADGAPTVPTEASNA